MNNIKFYIGMHKTGYMCSDEDHNMLFWTAEEAQSVINREYDEDFAAECVVVEMTGTY